ncbi:MAG: CPBP family intramembrane metalloprotease [Bacteroidales bacterium]|nr:CPBP family intramembrane metalloprotease [Bacteroidales bacterium]
MKPKTTLHASIIILTFLVALYGKSLLQNFIELQFSSYAIRIIYSYSWWVIPVVIVTAALYGFRNVLKNLGLQKGFLMGLAFSIIVVLPMFLGSAIIGKFVADMNLLQVFHKTFLAGFMEELLFRGFLFGLLFRKLKWGFIPASLPGAIIFGMSHLYQGSGITETLGIFTVTFIGALWFAWLYIEWDDNLWVPIWMHILMNLSWTIFDVSSNALGGFEANIFRIITIALSVLITIAYCRRRKLFRINKSNLLINPH